ncbi:unnamed protein product [Mytilus edulis]|uniref:CD80-like immunoglobulin C2-set domain-containing protein n=1 Tax=Mytilus edulis TaxID=6550 RepID=A0A8S3QRQ9_MYTED|nr:unnamed protein product [Mytilus edulis]
MTNITQNSTEATMIFNELKCTDQNQYRCKVTYLNTNIEVDSKMSLPTTITIINVTDTVLTTDAFAPYFVFHVVVAKPQTPHISSNVIQQNHNIEKRSILQGEVINRSSIYQATNVTDLDTSSILIPREGDNVTLVCNGNVGRPPGNIMWQIFHMNENILFKVTETNQTEPSPWKCSFNRTSYLTFQLSAVDFNAKIRCFVVSYDGNNETYVTTAPLKFHFGVRHASINKLPDKQTYDTTIKNITLMCNADGNPKPAYTWYRKRTITPFCLHPIDMSSQMSYKTTVDVYL